MKKIYNNNLVIFHSNKDDGNISLKFDYDGKTLQNKVTFFNKVDIDLKKSVLLKVLNKDEVFELDDDYIKQNKDVTWEINADAVITRLKNIFLYLNFADCIPFVLYDRKQEIVAFAHLGWRSVEYNLQTKLAEIFINKYHSNVNDLEAYLGPSIKKDSYILESPNQLNDNKWNSFIEHVKDNLYQLDLDGYVVYCLTEKGLDINKIHVSEIDTCKNTDYFSHYRCANINKEEIEGRFAFGVGIIDKNKEDN